ncbi:MAG: hypothetical protein QXZ63_03455 [Sulfolobales archaeon]
MKHHKSAVNTSLNHLNLISGWVSQSTYGCLKRLLTIVVESYLAGGSNG